MKIVFLKSFIHLYARNKIQIIKYWLKYKKVREVLRAHEIEPVDFVKDYAAVILDYYIDVVEGKHSSKEFPVIDELLIFLKNKNLSSSEFYTLSVGFRNSLIEYTYDLKIANLQIEKEINYIFEESFYSVLDKYTETLMSVKEELSKSTDIVDRFVIMSRTNPEGIIVSVSKAFCDISGYSEEELIGESHSILRHPDMQDEIYEDLWKSIKNGQTWNAELKNKRKDGTYYWVDAHISPVFDENGNIIFYDAIRQDITSKKDLEEQQNMLIEQSKAAAMGEMISMIAHQWRQPLQAVSILIQKLPITKSIEGVIPEELLEQVVDGIGTQLEYMSKTIDDFRDFFLPDKPKENILASELINKALEFVSFMLKTDGIEVKIEIQKDTHILVHVNELVQVLINLLKNSKDALDEHEIEDKIINICICNSEEWAVIEIEDNAGGIPEDIINKIFEPYFSTKSDKNGTGLGLYMCKTIVEKHSEGRLSVKNSELGAKFKIELPIS